MRRLFTAIFAACLFVPGSLSRADTDEVAAARALARSGKRTEAVAKLESHLGRHPDDTDGRVLLGIVLSWEGRYDDARAHLERVLDGSPLHYDAVRALINVELWSNRPDRAERLADRAIAGSGEAPDLLLARAKARAAQGREKEARADVDRARSLDPTSIEAQGFGRELRWRVGGVAYYDWFSDDRSTWKEAQVNLKRQMRWGSLIGRYWKVEHFETRDDQVELEAWPRIRVGTYAFLDATTSIDRDTVYADYSLGGEIYQSLGRGFEGSLGYRHLDFDGSGVDIWTGSLSKYLGDWLVTGRTYYVPGSPSDSWSFYLQARRYFGDGSEYWSVRAGRGTYREQFRTTEDFVHLSSHSISAELWKRIGERFELTAGAGYSSSGRASLTDLEQYSTSFGLYYRF